VGVENDDPPPTGSGASRLFRLRPDAEGHYQAPIDLRGEGLAVPRQSVEFVPATPLEYLDRWCLANEVFGDQVQLRSVVRWRCGHVSFGIAQPYYDGEPAPQVLINEFFLAEGWTLVRDPTREHILFYNYAFQVLAIDAVRRNCFYRDGYLMPFDVILCRPDPELEAVLELYPD
jgi:hypothetical protein